MQKIYVNTTTRTWYNADGDQFADGFPRLAYKRSERFVIQLCSATPDAGTPGVDPENDWPKDTQYGLPGVTALLSVDDDFLRRRKGALASELAAGKVSQLVATISGASVATIRSAGTLRLFDSVGNMEGLHYTGYSISGETVTFTLAEDSELKNSYAAKSVMDVPDALYMQAAVLIDESDPANGLFVFDLVAYTPKLRETMEYSNVSSLENLAGMELLIFTVNDVTTTECDSYLCSTCSVSATMAEADPDAQMPDTSADALIALIAAAIGYGYDRQFSVDGETNWHDEQADEDRYMRARLSVSGAAGAWLVWRLSAGTPGRDGTDGADTYTYIAYARDAAGTDFSFTPSDALKYRAEIHPDTDLSHVPVVSDGVKSYDRYAEGDGEILSVIRFNEAEYTRYPAGDAGNYYAWGSEGELYFTANTAPGVGDTVFSDAAGTDSGFTVAELASGHRYFAWRNEETLYYTAAAEPIAGNTIFTDTALSESAATVESCIGAKPDLDDFTAAGAVWVKYLGEDGEGSGDMLKSQYDSNQDGIVDHAALADAAQKLNKARNLGNAPFDGSADITLAQMGAATARHDHFKSAITDFSVNAAEITDPVRRKVCSEANPRTLYLDSPVLVNSATNTAATLTFDFTTFKVKPGGDSYSGQEGDDLTWVYRVTSSVNITSVAVGSMESTMEAIDVPADLPLLDGRNTVFVFVIHAIYDSSAFNRLRMFVNYSHCYKAALQ